MGAGRGDVRSRGLEVRSESGVFRFFRDLGSNALPATLEAVAVTVHLQDMDVVGEPVQQCAGEAFRAEDLGPLVEGQVGGDQDGAPFVALAEDLEEQFRAGGGHGHEAQFIDDQQAEAGQIPLQVEQRYRIPGLRRSALPKLKPRWDLHLWGDGDWFRRHSETLPPVPRGRSGAVPCPPPYAYFTLVSV